MGAEEEWGGAVSSPPHTSRVSSRRSDTALSSMCEERGEKAVGMGSVPDSRNLGLWDLAVGAWLSQLWHLHEETMLGFLRKAPTEKKMTKINNKCNFFVSDSGKYISVSRRGQESKPEKPGVVYWKRMCETHLLQPVAPALLSGGFGNTRPVKSFFSLRS